MNLFNLFATLTLDNSEYEKKLDQSQKSAGSFSSKVGTAFKTGARAVAAFGTAVVAASALVAKLALNAIDYGSQIDDSAQKIGFSTEAYQFWSLVLERAGSNAEVLNMAIRNMTTFTDNLAKGQGDALLALQELGIGYEEFMAMSPEEQFYTLVEALQGMDDQTKKASLAQQIFGDRVYQELLPLLNMEQGSLEDLRKEFEDLGLIMSDDTIKAMAAVGDKLDNLKNTFKVVAATIGAELLPEISLIIDGLIGLARGSDDAMQMLSDGLVGLISKVSQALPTIINTAGDLLLNIIVGLTDILSDPKIIKSLVNVLTTLFLKVVEILPTLTSSFLDIALAILDGLLALDWGTIILELVSTIIEILIFQLPEFILDALGKIWDKVIGLFTSDKDKFIEFGKALAEMIINGLIAAFEDGLNFIIDSTNTILDGISKAWTWAGIPEIPDIPNAHIGRVDFTGGMQATVGGGSGGGSGRWADGGMMTRYANGGVFDGMGTLYALAGEAGPEIVAHGVRGTGVANIEQIADAQYMAMRDYDLRGAIQEAAVAIVNGIVAGLSSTGDNSGRTPVIFRISDKDFIGYIETALNNSLQSQGRKTIRNVTAYGTRG